MQTHIYRTSDRMIQQELQTQQGMRPAVITGPLDKEQSNLQLIIPTLGLFSVASLDTVVPT